VERWRGILIGVFAIALPMVALAGGGAGAFILPALVVGGVIWAVVALAPGRRRRTEGRWTPVGPFEFEPTAGHEPAGTAQVARELGRVEGRQLLPGSAAFGTGIGFAILGLVLFGWVWARDGGGELAAAAETLPIVAHPLVGMTILAVHRARTRARRDGLDELFTTLPAGQHHRNLGHLASAWVPVAAALVAGAAMLALHALRADVTWGPFGARQLTHVVEVGLLAAGGVALGVLVARWAPWTLAPVVAVVAVGVASIELATIGDGPWDPRRQLSTWLGDPQVDLRFTYAHWLSRTGWLAALVVLVGLLALVRDAPRPARLAPALAVVVVLAGVAAAVTTRPIPADAAQRIADELSHPERHQTCIDAGIPVCAYRGDEDLARAFARNVAPVVAAVPSGHRPDVRVRQGATVELRSLDPRIADRVRLPTDGALAVEMTSHPDAYRGARFRVALAALEVNPSGAAGAHGQPVVLRGQARGVIAIWLATRGLEAGAATRMASTRTEPGDGHDIVVGPWPDECMAGPVPVIWAYSDLAAARALLALPDDRVARVVADRWDDLTDPTLTTDQLLAAVGLDPMGGPTGATPGPSPC
jgi:hypothetical protein